MASLIVASFQSTQKVKVNNADTLPNFAKAVPMQPEQKKHAQSTTSQLREGIIVYLNWKALRRKALTLGLETFTIANKLN